MNPAFFESLRLKLGRAQLHTETMRDHVVNPSSQRVVAELNPEHPYFRMILNELPTPSGWSLELGDAVHNLRSGLDHLALGLVLDGGNEPGDWTEFPIFEDETSRGWTNPKGRAQRTLGAITDSQRDVIESVQPYNWAHVGKTPSEHPLARLARLDNHDKHRVITTLVSRVVIVGFQAVGLRDCVVDEVHPNLNVRLYGQAEIGRGRITAFGPRPQVQMDTEFVSHVSLEDGADAVELTNKIARYILDEVLARLGIKVEREAGSIWA